MGSTAETLGRAHSSMITTHPCLSRLARGRKTPQIHFINSRCLMCPKDNHFSLYDYRFGKLILEREISFITKYSRTVPNIKGILRKHGHLLRSNGSLRNILSQPIRPIRRRLRTYWYMLK